VRRILREIRFPTLASVGVGEHDLAALADDALADYFITVAPVPWTREDVVACYRDALALGER
jgi:alcohol dehydrogenase